MTTPVQDPAEPIVIRHAETGQTATVVRRQLSGFALVGWKEDTSVSPDDLPSAEELALLYANSPDDLDREALLVVARHQGVDVGPKATKTQIREALDG